MKTGKSELSNFSFSFQTFLFPRGYLGLTILIREKKQRLEVVRAVQCIHQYVFLTPNDSNPARERMLTQTGAGGASALIGCILEVFGHPMFFADERIHPFQWGAFAFDPHGTVALVYDA